MSKKNYPHLFDKYCRTVRKIFQGEERGKNFFHLFLQWQLALIYNLLDEHVCFPGLEIKAGL